MNANRPSPANYDQTAVLIFGWDESTDSAKTAEEVRRSTPSSYNCNLNHKAD